MSSTAIDNEIAATASCWTAREIAQQPAVWLATRALVDAMAPGLADFLRPLLARRELRIILTGAGSSAYIGECLRPTLLECLGRRVEAIATTDLVAGPAQYFTRDVPTLLVSFARSGSSPESLAAVALAERHVDECYQLGITCNPAGQLAQRLAGGPRSRVLLLPEATHDRGFAMTSSFSSMLYAACQIFAPEALPAAGAERLSAAAGRLLASTRALVGELAERRHRRTVYLGSRGLGGLAREAALKLLELTDGEIAVLAETTLGFRHGPKSFVNGDTLVVVFLSSDPLTRRYDLDLAREVRSDGIAGRLLVLSAPARDLDGLDAVEVEGLEGARDEELAFAYVAFAQQLALALSLACGRTPDTPSASGTVNRVVQGVTIYSPAGG